MQIFKIKAVPPEMEKAPPFFLLGGTENATFAGYNLLESNNDASFSRHPQDIYLLFRGRADLP